MDRREIARTLREVASSYFTHKRFAVFHEVEVYPRRTGLRIPGGRCDVLALNTRGEIIIVEIKSCRADFQTDHKAGKWRAYLHYCNRLYFAFPPTMKIPSELEAEKEVGIMTVREDGLMKVVRPAKKRPVVGKLRKSLVLSLIFRAADRDRLSNRKRVRWPKGEP